MTSLAKMVPKQAFSPAFLLFTALFAVPAPAADFELHGYLRAGTGTNGKGARQECFRNDGSAGNEWRLGNECGIYGESVFLANLLKGQAEEPFFRTQVRFAFFPSGNSSFEDDDKDGRDINIVEAFAEAGNLDGSPLTFWAGKRFYRDVDFHIYDWYYFAEMNGNGAGVGNVPLGGGRLNAAYLVQTGSTRTNLGLSALQVLDLRWLDVPIGRRDSLNFWAAYGQAPAGALNGLHYQGRNGALGSVRWRRNLEGGFNDFTVGYGENVLEGINLYGTSALTTAAAATREGRPQRWRVVNAITKQIGSRWAIQAGGAAQFWDERLRGADSRGQWWSVGARPIYFWTKHYQLAFEAGHSRVNVATEKNADGSAVGTRQLTRLTIAPQIAPAPNFWARPVLRLFYTRSFWNGANQANMAVNAPSFAGSLSGHALGVQAEAWF